MCELDYKESWAPKNWCFWTVVLQKTLESPLGCKEIQPVHPRGNQSWIFIGRTDVEAETPVLWALDAKSWLIWKDPDAGKDRWEEKGMTEDEMVGWHHRLNGHGLGWTPGVGDGQGGLLCCGSWGCKESDMTERVNWSERLYGGDTNWTLILTVTNYWCLTKSRPGASIFKALAHLILKTTLQGGYFLWNETNICPLFQNTAIQFSAKNHLQ